MERSEMKEMREECAKAFCVDCSNHQKCMQMLCTGYFAKNKLYFPPEMWTDEYLDYCFNRRNNGIKATD